MSEAQATSARPDVVSQALGGAPMETLDAAGLHTLYETLIHPQLVGFETERVAASRTFWTRIAIGMPVALVAGIGVGMFNTGWGFGVGLVVAVLAGVWAYGPLEAVGRRAKIAVLNAIAGALGVRYELSDFVAPNFDTFRELDLLPGYDRSSKEDLFSGVRSGCEFGLYDAHLERESRDSKGNRTWTTVFRGSLVSLKFPNEFLGLTIVRRDAGIFNMFQKKGNLQKVGLVDSRFERIFEVFGSDQVEARYLVHPVFMEKLMALETAFKGGKIRCAFCEGDLLIAVEGKNRFEIGGLFSNLAEESRVTSMANDVTTVMSLIDTVLAGPPPAYQAEIAAARAQLQAEATAQQPSSPPIVQG